MHNQKQHPILCDSDCRIPILLVDTCVFHADKSIKENLTCYLKAHTVLVGIAGRLFRVPHEALTEVKGLDVLQYPRIYNIYTICWTFKYKEDISSRFEDADS